MFLEPSGRALELILVLGRRSKNASIQLYVASVLNTLVSNPSSVRQLKEHHDVITVLKAYVRSRAPEIKQEALEALSKLGFIYVSKRESNSHRKYEVTNNGNCQAVSPSPLDVQILSASLDISDQPPVELKAAETNDSRSEESQNIPNSLNSAEK